MAKSKLTYELTLKPWAKIPLCLFYALFLNKIFGIGWALKGKVVAK